METELARGDDVGICSTGQDKSDFAQLAVIGSPFRHLRREALKGFLAVSFQRRHKFVAGGGAKESFGGFLCFYRRSKV